MWDIHTTWSRGQRPERATVPPWWGVERSFGWERGCPGRGRWVYLLPRANCGQGANEDGKRRTGKHRGKERGRGRESKRGEERCDKERGKDKERDRGTYNEWYRGLEGELVGEGREDRTRNGVTVTYIMRAPVRAHALSLETARHSLLCSGALTAHARSHRCAPTTPRIRSSLARSRLPGHRYAWSLRGTDHRGQRWCWSSTSGWMRQRYLVWKIEKREQVLIGSWLGNAFWDEFFFSWFVVRFSMPFLGRIFNNK